MKREKLWIWDLHCKATTVRSGRCHATVGHYHCCAKQMRRRRTSPNSATRGRRGKRHVFPSLRRQTHFAPPRLFSRLALVARTRAPPPQVRLGRAVIWLDPAVKSFGAAVPFRARTICERAACFFVGRMFFFRIILRAFC